MSLHHGPSCCAPTSWNTRKSCSKRGGGVALEGLGVSRPDGRLTRPADWRPACFSACWSFQKQREEGPQGQAAAELANLEMAAWLGGTDCAISTPSLSLPWVWRVH